MRRLAFSIDWQDEIIRAAITLKLCNFEETGAIVAALTTSIPEGPGSGRTWDYRFCWMRDAFFVVRALNRIGATRTMEDFISYILSVAAGRADSARAALRRRAHRSARGAHAASLAGYRRRRPGAHRQCRDGRRTSTTSMAASSWRRRRCSSTAGCRVRAMRRCSGCSSRSASRRRSSRIAPDAGIWEYRGKKRVHTHSAAMCWAGCQRLEAIAAHLGLADRAQYWGGKSPTIGEEVLKRAWNAKRKAFSAAFGSDDLDASCLLLAELGLIAPDDPRFVSTVKAIERELRRDSTL